MDDLLGEGRLQEVHAQAAALPSQKRPRRIYMQRVGGAQSYVEQQEVFQKHYAAVMDADIVTYEEMVQRDRDHLAERAQDDQVVLKSRAVLPMPGEITRVAAKRKRRGVGEDGLGAELMAIAPRRSLLCLHHFSLRWR